jgi:hypothetical protein
LGHSITVVLRDDNKEATDLFDLTVEVMISYRGSVATWKGFQEIATRL